MKASQITQPGFYWSRRSPKDSWEVVKITMVGLTYNFVTFNGSGVMHELGVWRSRCPEAEFVGPIPAPEGV